MEQRKGRELFCAVATAAILSFSTAPVWAQTSHTSNSRSEKGVRNDNMIPSDKLQGATVVDNQNKDVGKIKEIFLDPKTGKIQRADVDFSTGTGDTYSVTWNQLHVTQKDNGDVVAKIDESVVKKVQQANNNHNNNNRSSTR
jgi:sporulation protein YlmC with PRC-barrel domain